MVKAHSKNTLFDDVHGPKMDSERCYNTKVLTLLETGQLKFILTLSTLASLCGEVYQRTKEDFPIWALSHAVINNGARLQCVAAKNRLLLFQSEVESV